MRRVIGALAVALLFFVAACSSSHSATTVAHSSPKPTLISSAQRCVTAFQNWKPIGGADLLNLTDYINQVDKDVLAVGTDVLNGAVPGNDGIHLAGSLGGMMGVAARIQSKGMPPACVPGLDADYTTITANLISAGSAYTVFLGAANQLNPVKAQAALTLANSYLAIADGGFKSAQAHATSFEAGNAS